MAKSTDHEVGGSDPTFFKGSFFIYLLFVPAFLVLILAILLAMQYKQLKTFVSPNAIALPSVPNSPESQEQVLQKIHAFFIQDSAGVRPVHATEGGIDSTQVKEQNSTRDSLFLVPSEINYLIRSSKSLQALNLDYHMDIEDTLLIAHNSLPVSHVNGFLAFLARILLVKGYLNSEMRGYISFANGEIKLIPISATMNNVPAPVSVLNRKGGIDPKEWIADTLFYRHALNQLTAIKIRNNTLILVK